MRIPAPLPVAPGDEAVLRAWIADGEAPARRARIVLLARAGLGPSVIAEELGCSKQTVITWRERYRSGGLDGLRDAPRSGRPATVDATAVVLRTLEPHTAGAARWSTRLLAAELGISNVAVANVWRSWGIVPGPAGGVRLAAEPAIDGPVAAVAGVHLDPPLRLLALLVGGPGAVSDGEPALPVRDRPDVGDGLAEMDTGATAVDGPPSALAAFLGRLDGVRTPDGGARLLLAEAASEPVRAVAQHRPGTALHVVPPALSWERMARVACLLAGGSAGGAASVAALRDALAGHVAGEPFSWVGTVATKM